MGADRVCEQAAMVMWWLRSGEECLSLKLPYLTRTNQYFNYVPLCTLNGDGLRLQSVQHGKAMLLADTLGAQHTITKPRGACSWERAAVKGFMPSRGHSGGCPRAPFGSS